MVVTSKKEDVNCLYMVSCRLLLLSDMLKRWLIFVDISEMGMVCFDVCVI